MTKLQITDDFLLSNMNELIKKEVATSKKKEVEIGILYNINKWTLERLEEKNAESKKLLKDTYKKFYTIYGQRIIKYLHFLKALSAEMRSIIRKKNKDPFYKLHLEDLRSIDLRMSMAVYDITNVFPQYPTLEDKYIKMYFTLQDTCRDEFHWIDKKRLEKK